MMIKKIVIVGNSNAARLLWHYLKQDARYQVCGLAVDRQYLGAEWAVKLNIKEYELSDISKFFSPEKITIINGMGYSDICRLRESFFHQLKGMGYRIETYIHPSANVFDLRALKEGVIVLPNAVIEPGSKIGSNVVVCPNVTVAHDAVVSDNSWVASGAVISGEVIVGKNVFIGVNSTIVNRIVVGDFSIVGAGAIITRDTKNYSVILARSGEEHRFNSQDYAKYYGF